MKLSVFSSSNPKSPQPIASSLKQKKSVPISGHPYLYFNINSWLIIDSLFIYCASGTFTDYLGNAYIPMIILSVLLSAATFSFVSLCIPADFYFSLMFYSTIIMFICTIIECFPVPSFLFFALRCILSIVRVPCFLFILHNAVFHNLKNPSSFINSYLWSLFFGFFYSFLFGYLIGEYLIWNIYYIILAPFCLIYMLILYVIYIKQSKYIFNQRLYSFFSFHREHTTQSLNESIIHPNDASLIVYSFSTATVKENVSSLTQKNTLYSILSTSFLYCFFMLFFYYYPIAFDKIHRICSLKCTHSILLSSFLVSILLYLIIYNCIAAYAKKTMTNWSSLHWLSALTKYKHILTVGLMILVSVFTLTIPVHLSTVWCLFLLIFICVMNSLFLDIYDLSTKSSASLFVPSLSGCIVLTLLMTIILMFLLSCLIR